MPDRYDECETCGRERDLWVYALPGVPVSVANCAECLGVNAYPLCVAKWYTDSLRGIEHAAEWWKESVTWKDGQYVTIGEALR